MTNLPTAELLPIKKSQNRLAMLMKGVFVPDVVRPAAAQGTVSQLWNPFIGGNNRFARKGVTGAEIAQILCEQGSLEYMFNGQIIAAGTPTDQQPDYELVRTENSRYRFLKPIPTRDQFNQSFPTASARNAETEKLVVNK